MLALRSLIGEIDILLVSLESLRFDAACLAQTPWLKSWLPAWEARHSPASFTYAAHQAFFSGFLPTPARPGRHPRLFASRFAGSQTTHPQSWVFEQATLPEALAARGYATICIGGTAFFNRQNALGSVLPGLFQQAFWQPNMGVRSKDSARIQVGKALKAMHELAPGQRLFLFLNLSATHAPTHIYLPGARHESIQTQAAALEYAEPYLVELLTAFGRRGRFLAIFCGDHGEALGEEGYWGHRLGHASVWTVPYAEALIEREPHTDEPA